jgi:hypothetical protein
MKIIAFSMCAAMASFAGAALADEGLTQGPAHVSDMQCNALDGSARTDCEQRVLGPDDGNQFSEKQMGNRLGAADLSGAADASLAESVRENRATRDRTNAARAGEARANCPRE